jgi:hypothetical protein
MQIQVNALSLRVVEAGSGFPVLLCKMVAP